MKVTCIVASAGRGKRLRHKEDKPFVKLLGRPILFYTLKVLNASPVIDDIVLVVAEDKISKCKNIIKRYKLKKIKAIVKGGKRRFDSVKNGLKETQDSDYIFIHDGVRPFLDKKLIKRIFTATKKYGAALPATNIKQTPKLINKDFFIKNTPERKLLWEAQTPQAFKKDIILKAYDMYIKGDVTDDASLVERLGGRIKIVNGTYRNIKITTPEDIEFAKVLLRRNV